MSYTRRVEMTWTEAELTRYGDKILLANEALYIKKADGTRTVRFGDGVTAVKNLPVSIDYGAVKAQADIATTKATAAAKSAADALVTKGEVQNIKDSFAGYTKDESDSRYANSIHLHAEGYQLDIPTASSPMEMSLSGEGRQGGEPTPDNLIEVQTVGGLCEWDGILEQGTISNGVMINDSSRVRTTNYVNASGEVLYRVIADVATEVTIYQYNADKSKYTITNWVKLPYDFITLPDTKYLKYIFKKGDSNITPAEVTATICPVLRYLKSSGNLLRNGYGNSNTVFGSKMSDIGDGYLKVINIASENQGARLYGPSTEQIYVKPNTEYTILAEVIENTLTAALEINMEGGSTSAYSPFPRLTIPTKATGRFKFKVKSPTTIASKSFLYTRCTIGGADGQVVVIRVMMFEGDVPEDTPYQNGSVDNVNIPLMDTNNNPLQLAAIPDGAGGYLVRDKIVRAGDTYQVQKSVFRDTFTGADGEGWATYSTAIPNCFMALLSHYTKEVDLRTVKGLANWLVYYPALWGVEYSGTTGFASSNGRGDNARRIFTRVKGIDTLAKWKALLQSKATAGDPLTAYFAAETPWTVSLHPDTVAALNALSHALPDRTVIECQDSMAPWLTAEYVVSTQKLLDDKMDRAKPPEGLYLRGSVVDQDIVSVHSADFTAVELAVKGKSAQNTTTGKNLLPNTKLPGAQTINGVTFTVNADKSVSVKGTATKNASYYLATDAECAGRIFGPGTYAMSDGAGGTDSTFDVRMNIKKDGVNYYMHSSTSCTVTQGIEILQAPYIVVLEGQTVNVTIYPQLEKGSAATPYEPYTGGQPSPNPNYPQPIRSVGGEHTWNGVLEQGGFTTGIPSASTIRVRSADFAQVQPGATYRAEFTGNDLRIDIKEYDRNKNFIKDNSKEWQPSGFIYSVSSNTYYVKYHFYKVGSTVVSPADVTGVCICPVVKAYSSGGKNLLRYLLDAALPNTYGGVTTDFDKTNCIFKFNGTATGPQAWYWGGLTNGAVNAYLPCKEGQPITITVETLSGTCSGAVSIYNNILGTNMAWPIPTKAGKTSKTYILAEDYVAQVWIYWGNNGVFNNLEIRVQVEYGSTSTEYTHPIPAIDADPLIDIPLRDIHGNPLEPLRGISDNARDKIVHKDGLWQIERNIQKWTVPGNASLYGYGNYDYNGFTGLFLNGLPTASRLISNNMILAMSDKLIGIQADKMYVMVVNHTTEPRPCISLWDKSYLMLYLPPEYYGYNEQDGKDVKLSKVRAALASNPITTYYLKRYATYETLHPDTQALLNKLSQMYYPQTVITGVDALSPTFDLTYVQDANYIISQLSSAVVAAGV